MAGKSYLSRNCVTQSPILHLNFFYYDWKFIYLNHLIQYPLQNPFNPPKTIKRQKLNVCIQKQKKRMEIIPQKLFNKITWPKKKSSPLQKKSSKRQITLLKSMDRKTFPRLYQNIWRKNVKKFHSKLKHRSYNIILQNFIHGFFVTYTHLLLINENSPIERRKARRMRKSPPKKKKHSAAHRTIKRVETGSANAENIVDISWKTVDILDTVEIAFCGSPEIQWEANFCWIIFSVSRSPKWGCPKLSRLQTFCVFSNFSVFPCIHNAFVLFGSCVGNLHGWAIVVKRNGWRERILLGCVV